MKIVSRFIRANKWQPSEGMVLGGAALTVGLFTGLGVWLFKELVKLMHWAAFTETGTLLGKIGSWTVFILPVVGGILVGLIVHFWIGEERHHGVAGIMEAVALAGGRLRYRRVPAKAIASAISIGSGASVGPEDPSVQIGANIGSFFGQILALSDERRRTLVAAGAASGVAAAFNAPIAGVFFTMEIILGEIGGSALGVVVLAAVIASVITQVIAGTQPAFKVPAYAFGSAWELPLYLGLGLLAGPISAAYVQLLYRVRDLFHQTDRVPSWLKPAVAGLIVGLVGIFLPQIFGDGYSTIEDILANAPMGLVLLIALVVAKLVMTPTSIGGGFLGGVFAPSLFIGATLGAAYGQVANWMFPGMHIAVPAYAMVGMAAVLAGAVHAPLTAILLLFEMTNDYRIILPLMFAVIVSLVVSQRLQPFSVYTLSLARKGIRLERGKDVEVLETVTVEEVMQNREELDTINDNSTLTDASELLLRTRHHGLPVVDENNDLVGVFTIQDLDKVNPDEWEVRQVGEVCTHDPMVAYEDETIGAALRRMSGRDIGRLPVVDRENPRRLVGLLRRTDLVRAYDAALTKRAAQRHRVQQVRLGAETSRHVGIEEIVVRPGAPCESLPIGELDWPRECIIASIRRRGRTMIPHGDTRLQAGDTLLVVSDEQVHVQLLFLCGHEVPE